MSPKHATKFLLWYGEKALAGDEPTEEELAMFKEAREVSKRMVKFMGISPKDYEYTKGQPFR